MSRFDLVIFDYDGVIADSELLNNQAMAEVLTGIGLPTTLDQSLGLYMGRRWLDCRPDIEAELARDGRKPDQSDLAEMDGLWDAAKVAERRGASEA